MPTLVIDNRSVTVSAGTNVLQAAIALGIVVPHFCFHEALGVLGACRLCAVSFLEGPVKGVKMSCLVEAQDGMVVSTLDPAAQELRRCVIEWLMINHPHDCPVCDEGGECQLQDMTVAGGHAFRRFRGRKRTYRNQDLGPFVEHEMNRCIQCYRCVRTYRDFCGWNDFGVLGVNQRVYFGRYKDGRLASPFSGNLVDVCPTGVLTDKTFRFRARPWDLEEAPSICPHCSLGCATTPSARYRELVRVRARVNRETNGFFICDRGRFGYGHANHPERPRTPRADGRAASFDEALAVARERILGLAKRHGGGALAFLGSARASLEANALLLALAQSLRSDRISFECNPGRDHVARVCATALGERARSLEEIRGSDFVLILGADLLNQGPLMALAVRQAVRRGAFAAVLDPRPVALPFPAAVLVRSPEQVRALPDELRRRNLAPSTPDEAAVVREIADRLDHAGRPVLVGGAALLGAAGAAALIGAAEAISVPGRACGVALMLAGPNSFGGGLLAGDGPDFEDLIEEIEAGRIKALVCLQADPLSDHPEPERVAKAFSRLELLVVLDGVPSRSGREAKVFLPTTVIAEEEGTFVNNEGRMLGFRTVFSPGLPVCVTGNRGHPPREFSNETPGGLPRPAWSILCALMGRTASLEQLRQEIEGANSRLFGLAKLDPAGPGLRVAAGTSVTSVTGPVFGSLAQEEHASGLRLLCVEALFGSELLASFSAPLQSVRSEPEATIHFEDGTRLGIADGQRVRLNCSLGEVDLRVRLSAGMARGLVIVPQLRGTALASFVPGPKAIPCRIEPEVAP